MKQPPDIFEQPPRQTKPRAGNLVIYPAAWDAVTRRAEAVREARTLIPDLACIGINLDCIAKAFKISRRALEREYAATVGRSTRQEIAQTRLNRAKFLLETTNQPIQNIGEKIGYWKPASFVAFFRKQTGMSPAAYRGSNLKSAARLD